MTRLNGALLGLAVITAAGTAAAQTPGTSTLAPGALPGESTLTPDIGPPAPIVGGRQHQPTQAEVQSRLGPAQARGPAARKPGQPDEVDDLANQLLKQSAPPRR